MTDLRPLGTPDLLVSAVGLGCNNFGRPGFVTESLPATKSVLDAALEHGVTFLDTAALYGSPAGTSESLMGEALRGRRDRVVLATKFGHRGGGPHRVDVLLVHPDADARLVAEDDAAVGDLLIDPQADRRVEVLDLEGEVVGDRGGGVRHRIRVVGHRAHRRA